VRDEITKREPIRENKRIIGYQDVISIEELGKILVRHSYIFEDNLFQVYDELKIISI
jgi:hypothetical protein